MHEVLVRSVLNGTHKEAALSFVKATSPPCDALKEKSAHKERFWGEMTRTAAQAISSRKHRTHTRS